MTISRDVIQRLLNVVNDTRRRLNTVESREYVLLTAAQTLTNKTLTTPTISNFTNAAHNHSNAAGGGQLSLTTAVSGILPPANGGTGVNNATRTLTINTNSGTLSFGAASKTLTINENLNLSGASGQTLTLTNSLTVQGGGNTVLSSSGNFTLTIPKTGTVPVGTGTAGRIAEWVTDANTVQASTLAKTGAGVLTLAASGNFTLTVPATGTAALLATAQTFTADQTVPFLRISGASGAVTANTSDGSDTSIVSLAGGGAVSNSRGAYVNAFGNEYSAIPAFTGNFIFEAGNVATGHIRFFTGGAQRAHIDNSGYVGIGTTAPSALLHVNQSSATGAVPTLRLHQADLSEEMIRFDTTVGTGNPVNTTALGAYYGRVRVWVEGVGAKWLALYN